jgi:hypothetical protein
MHLFGLQWDKVIYPYNNQQQIITANRPAKVVSEILS